MHDRIAELAGLRAELAICENGPDTSRRDKTGEVQTEIDRVRGELSGHADDLDAEAEELAGKGQDVPAAQAAVDARQIRAVLDEDTGNAPKKARAGSGNGKRNTAAAKAPEQT